jgi:PqqD family protein of HPr-rel-A system
MDYAMTFRRNPSIEAAPLQNELMLFNASTKKFCVLNSTAAQLWECLAEPRSTNELVSALRTQFKTNGATVEEDVAKVMQELEGLGLVVREEVTQ